MALVTRLASDLTGVEGDEETFLNLVIRKHPSLDREVALDVLPPEIEGLKELTDVVVLQITDNSNPSLPPRQVICRLADFNKLAEDMDAKVAAARNVRGRRPGSRNGM